MHVSIVRAGSGVPLLVLASVLWGTGGLLGQALAGATGLSAVAVAAYRLGGGGLLLCAQLLLSGRPVPRSGAAWRRMAVVGLLAAIFQSCYFLAVVTTSVSLATLVTIGIAPVAVLAVERVARLRPLGARSVLGAVLALVGLALLVGLTGTPGPGLLAAVVSGCAFSAMTLLSARPVPGLDAGTTIGFAFTIGGALLLPLAFAAGGPWFTPTATALWLLLAFLVVPTAVAYTAYLAGLLVAPAGVGAVVTLLEPLTAALLAALLLGDRLGLVGWTGAVVLCCAVALVAGDRAD